MLQKLETLYLGILRFVVIVVAGVLLVAVVILGLNSVNALRSAPPEKEPTPTVSDDSLRNSMLQSTVSTEAPAANQQSTGPTTDPNQQYFDRAAQAIVAFVTTYSGGSESPNTTQVAEITKRRANKYEKQKLAGVFAKNFADSVERLLKDPAIVAAAKQKSPLEIVNRLLNAFTEQFEEQIEKTAADNQAKQQEYIEKKAEGQQSLYMAFGAFGSFLVIVFLSIIIRIERNLRHLERPAA